MKSLSLDNIGFCDDGIEAICQLIQKNKTIEKLELVSNKIGLNGVLKLLDVIGNSSLKEIDFSQNDYRTEESMELIWKKIENMKQLFFF